MNKKDTHVRCDTEEILKMVALFLLKFWVYFYDLFNENKNLQLSNLLSLITEVRQFSSELPDLLKVRGRLHRSLKHKTITLFFLILTNLCGKCYKDCVLRKEKMCVVLIFFRFTEMRDDCLIAQS